MGCVGSDAEDELRTRTSVSKRFKFSKKCSDDGVAVDYASVPRKLRSAIKKRCHESISLHFPSYKKLNHTTDGVVLSRKDGLKKSKKQGVSDGCDRQVLIGPITKDEEEVAETLYALAAMFPDTAKMDKTKGQGEPSETKSSDFLGVENSRHAVEDTAAMEEEAGTKTISTDNAEAANHSSNVAGSAREVLISNAEHGIERPTSNTVVSGALSDINKGSGSKIPQPDLSLTSGSAAGIRGQHELLYTSRENKSNGSQLWPGLSSTDTRNSDMQRPSLQSSTSKLPAIFLDTSCSLRPQAFGQSVTTKEGAQVQVDSKKSRKRSPTHVYISSLIKDLQITEREKTLQMRCTQSTTSKGLNQGAHITSKLNARSNGLNRIVSTNSAVCSATERNSAEVKNAILLHKRLLQDQQQASTTSRLYTLQKQNIDFFSLSDGGARGEISNGTAKADNGLGMTTQLQVHHLQSKNHPVIPFLLPQNCYSSIPLISHPGAAAAHQVQLPPYLGSTNYSPLATGVTASSKQQPWQQQQQQQNWTNQLTAHCRPGQVAAPSIPNWQNGGQDAPSLLQYSQSIHSPSRSSVEVLGSNYALTSHQQQQLIAVSPPLPPSRVQGQHQTLPYSYEGKGGGRRPECVPPLQLLCNEHF